MRLTLFFLAVSLIPAGLVGQSTYSRDIAPLFQEKCQICHREGDIAPFALDSYDAAVTWGEDIQRVLQARIMPPWKPVADHDSFKNSYSLSDEQRDTILKWYSGGAEQGDPGDLPAPPEVASGEWQLGDPDLVLQMPVSFTVPRRKDTYRCFVIPTDFDADKYISAVQVVPGNRQVVHHVILYLDTTDASAKLDAQDDEPGYDCFGGPGDSVPLNLTSMAGGWVPGTRTARLPDGIGGKLPKGARIIMQVHYFPNGRVNQEDQTRVGIYFTDKVKKQLGFFPLVNTSFKIPAGAQDYEVTASQKIFFLADATAYVVAPHMHLLGREIKIEKINPDRSVDPLITINDWDFNWQGFYYFKEPVRLPAGTNLKLTCKFDNSENNPKNPSNPLKVVGWGESTEDEMCIGFVGVTFDNDFIFRLFDFNRRPAPGR